MAEKVKSEPYARLTLIVEFDEPQMGATLDRIVAIVQEYGQVVRAKYESATWVSKELL